MKKVLLKIDGMTCSACSSGLEKYLNKQNGINCASVNLVMNNASIEYNENILDISKIEEFIEEAGFESLGIDNFDKEEKKNNNKQKFKLVGITVFSLIILYVSMGHMIGLPSIPFLDMMTYQINYSIVLLILTLIVILFGRDILKNGYKNLIHKTPNMDTLVSIGVLSSFLYSIFGTIMIILGNKEYVDMLYFESSAIVIFFIKIGKYIESINKDKTKEAIKNLMTITPNHASIIIDGKEKQVTLDEINVDDVIICRPGEKIAVDGSVIKGVTHIDESFITGESVPVKKEAGSSVVAGSINYEGTIEYKAERIGKNSTVSEIVRLVVDASNTKAPIAKIADKISGYFVPVIIVLAFISFIVWLIISKEFQTALNVFVSILVVACPCSLGLATPLAIVMSSGICSKNGILVKSSESLENAHKVKNIVFDKTGTLTKGKLSVSKIFNYSDKSDNEILEIASSIERKSEHPIAKAIVRYAEENNLNEKQINEFKNIPGYGVYAKILEDEFFIGNEKLIQENNIEINCRNDADVLTKDGNSILYISQNKKIIALIGVMDLLKENVVEVINELKRKNIDITMLTGDNEKTARAIASKIGIKNIVANVSPKEKSEKIQELKKQGLVMMCGDGINDSVSLVTADIGVSVSSGTDIAMDSSNVILMNDNIEKINDLITISKKTIKNIKQNLFWAFFYNICMIPIAMGIFSNWGIVLNPMLASLAMTLSSFTVVANVLRLKYIKI